MATELKSAAKLSMTRFWGGKDQGHCLQLTQRFGDHHAKVGDSRYVCLRRDQAVELAHALLEFAMGTRPESED